MNNKAANVRKPYEKPEVTSFSELELSQAIEASGATGAGGGPP
jgi:hypothetical protein